MAKKRKAHSLTGRIDDAMMSLAFKAVKKNRGAAGIDKVSVQMFEQNLDENLKALQRELKTGTFIPKPSRRVWIPKDPQGTKLRPLGIPAVKDRVAEEVADGNILRLIEKFLAAGVMDNGVFKPTTIGTPQGGVVSPLLANIVLNKLDWRLEEKGYRFVRYADDFVVVCETRIEASAALEMVTQVLTELGLSLSPEKTKITSFGKGYDFLGFRLSSK